VIHALQTHIQLIRPCAIAVTRALARNRTVGADKAKIALADVRMDAGAEEATLLADWNALRIVLTGVFVPVPVCANTLEPALHIDALFGHIITIMMIVRAFVLGRTGQVVPVLALHVIRLIDVPFNARSFPVARLLAPSTFCILFALTAHFVVIARYRALRALFQDRSAGSRSAQKRKVVSRQTATGFCRPRACAVVRQTRIAGTILTACQILRSDLNIWTLELVCVIPDQPLLVQVALFDIQSPSAHGTALTRKLCHALITRDKTAAISRRQQDIIAHGAPVEGRRYQLGLFRLFEITGKAVCRFCVIQSTGCCRKGTTPVRPAVVLRVTEQLTYVRWQ
jgi:hypothetical protein